jgi:hypothetical protein
MPSVIDAPEIVEHEEHALSEEQPQTRAAHPGFWHTVVAYARRQRAHRLQRTASSDHRMLRPMASPMARLAQEHPTLFLLGFFGIHHG